MLDQIKVLDLIGLPEGTTVRIEMCAGNWYELVATTQIRAGEGAFQKNGASGLKLRATDDSAFSLSKLELPATIVIQAAITVGERLNLSAISPNGKHLLSAAGLVASVSLA